MSTALPAEIYVANFTLSRHKRQTHSRNKNCTAQTKTSRRKWFHTEMSGYSVPLNMADDDFDLGEEDEPDSGEGLVVSYLFEFK